MIVKLQCAFAADSTFPRDRFIITPHFNITSPGGDPQALCDDLAPALAAWCNGTREVKVTAYDSQGTKPVYPSGEAIVNLGQAPASTVPRELAVCLSYFATRNIPRHRGRLYIPLALTSQGGQLRPSATLRDIVASLVPIFENLGGIDVDWCLWSPTDAAAYKVTNWWVDDEWDTVRSRGLRPTTRTQGTTSA